MKKVYAYMLASEDGQGVTLDFEGSVFYTSVAAVQFHEEERYHQLGVRRVEVTIGKWIKQPTRADIRSSQSRSFR